MWEEFYFWFEEECADGLYFCPTCRKSKSIQKSNERPGRHIISRYGITEEQYLGMVDKQGGVCAICGKPCSIGRLSIDHCHITEKVRGLLCRRCNAGLGAFGDNVNMLEKAIDYLRKT